jgi:hypothetical protein
VAGLKIPEAAKTQIKRDVGDYLVEQITKSAGRAQSPVAGESWKQTLSPEYKKKKKAEGLPTKANMEESGDLLDSLTFEETGNGIELGWFGDQAGKADGHNNLSGKSDLPQRRTLPDVGQEFVSSIQSEIEKIVADGVSNSMEFEAKDFEDVNTKADLYDALSDYFPDLSRAGIKSLIARTPDLAGLLEDMDLLDLL